MSRFSKNAKSIIAVIAVVDMAVFSNLSFTSLISMIFGGIVVVLGLQYAFKLAAIIGLLIVGVTSAASMEIATVLELTPLVGSMMGLLVPMMILTGICLSADDESDQAAEYGRKQLAFAFAFAGLVLASAPLVSLVLSLIVPTMTMRFTAVTEIAIMMVFLIAGGMVLTRERKSVQTVVPEVKKEGA